MHIKPAVTLFAAVSMLVSVAQAEQTGDSVTFDFQGRFLINTPCKVNNDQIMDITFGNVGVKKVDGVNFMQTIPYTVDCQGAQDSTLINLTVSGTATTYDDAALTTSAEGLGIEIQANGQAMKLNQPLKTTLSGLRTLILKAVPVKDPTKELTAQTFSATATLTAEYQ